MTVIKATEIREARICELKEVKQGLEKQLKNEKGFLAPWELAIVKMHLDDINKELEKRKKY